MANERSASRSRGRAEEDAELWFTMPSSDSHLPPEQSAYRATSSYISAGLSRSASPQMPFRIPTISTTPDINKELPAPPSDPEGRTRKPAMIQSLLQSRSSNRQLNPSHLQPESHSHHQRHLSAGAHLTVDVHGYYRQQHSRSMPNSPYEHSYDGAPLHRLSLAPTQSVNTVYQSTTQYHSYSTMYEQPIRTNCLGEPAEISPTRARTFPDATMVSPAARNGSFSRPRPHTWLSPTEPFANAAQFHLFVEATTGLPDDLDPWSPNGPSRLQSSLFARRPSRGSIPATPQYVPAPIPDPTHQTASWQSFGPPLTSSRSVSAPISSLVQQDALPQPHANPTSHMNSINAELEMLGLDGDHSPDNDELPDYAQSQAEMDAKKRAEAAARARDLEARWRGARCRRS